MKTIEEAREFFEADLKHHAAEVDVERQRFVKYFGTELKKNAKWSGIVFLGGIILNMVTPTPEKTTALQSLSMAIPFIGPFLWMIFKLITLGMQQEKRLNKFRETFRQRITHPFLDFFMDGEGYKENEGIEEKVLENSLIVPFYYTTNSGGTSSKSRYLVESSYKMNIAGGELCHVFLKKSIHTNIDHWGGFFFRKKVDEDFSGQVVVRRELAEKFLGKAASDFANFLRSTGDRFDESWYEHGNRSGEGTISGNWLNLKNVHMSQDQAFEDNYRVRATSQELADQLLTPERLNWLKAMIEKRGAWAQFTFTDGYFYAYFFQEQPHSLDMAYRDYKKPVDTFDKMEQLATDLTHMDEMVRELKI